MISQNSEICQGDQTIVPVDDFQIPKVRGPTETLMGEMPAAHLGRCVEPRRSRVNNLSPELYHARMAC